MAGDLSQYERRVLDALRFLVDDNSRVTVSQNKLGQALGWPGARRVRESMRLLEARGLVLVHRNGKPNGRKSNTFEITAEGLRAEVGA